MLLIALRSKIVIDHDVLRKVAVCALVCNRYLIYVRSLLYTLCVGVWTEAFKGINSRLVPLWLCVLIASIVAKLQERRLRLL